jgi:hypothetical protein
MLASVVYVKSPFSCEREIKSVRRSCRVRKHAPDIQLPFICLFNGEPLLRAEWDRMLSDGDIVQFVTLAQGGGGGSNPLKIIMSIAISYFAPGLGTMLADEMGIMGAGFMASDTIFGVTMGQIFGGVISMAGNMLVNALIPAPKTSASQVPTINAAAASPTYSIGAQGNAARLGQPIPVMYG